MPLPQQLRDLFLCRVSSVGRNSRDMRKLHVGYRQQLFLNSGEGSEEHVILIAALPALTSFFHDSDDAEWQFADTQGLSDRVGPGKEIFSYCSSDDHYPGSSADI